MLAFARNSESACASIVESDNPGLEVSSHVEQVPVRRKQVSDSEIKTASGKGSKPPLALSLSMPLSCAGETKAADDQHRLGPPVTRFGCSRRSPEYSPEEQAANSAELCFKLLLGPVCAWVKASFECPKSEIFTWRRPGWDLGSTTAGNTNVAVRAS